MTSDDLTITRSFGVCYISQMNYSFGVNEETNGCLNIGSICQNHGRYYREMVD